ncbi:cytochrome P450 [Actinosynnema sp. NPDC047251]|uniref:Cytochrome P450 monooxygenase n=1 Tax=Saccharothrix espanaensis (strain ATCC 51144 / DSM 44229 / JCM 9112 / NBRC 15066 / NRRL 15764) TaxID=1179773 RepID=K0JZJ9_SACES|nr:cytochrome P450 [Saccharothrix espanaensis]CCH30712.1 Cytochrome P450 monooxygenase [Saccharothrix espanaensis DSM 44229]
MTSIFAPLSATMLADPHAVYARLRAEDPVHWHDQLAAWVLTRHDDCTRVLKDTTAFGSDPRALGKPLPDSVLSLQTLDPPEHTAVRRRFLHPLRAFEDGLWDKEIRRVARDLVDRLDGVVDFARDVAEPLALHAVCTLYGIPFPAEHERFRATSRTMVLGMDAGLDPARREPALAARDQLNAMIAGWRAAAVPGGVLASVEPGEDRVLRNSLRAVFDAGYSTTGNLLGNAVHWLTDRKPWRGAELAELDGRAADELIRLAGPVQAVSRHCKRDTELRGRPVRRGDVLVLVLAGANRDPEVFPDPDVADFTRSPNPHLGLGRGAHSCFGGHLGRHLLITLLAELARLDRIEAGGEPVRRPTATQRGLDRLPIRFSRGNKHAAA